MFEVDAGGSLVDTGHGGGDVGDVGRIHARG